MKNDTFIVAVVFAFLLGLLLKVNTDHQIVYNEKQIETKVVKQINQQELICLAKNVYFEAGAEPIEGKAAVAQVTMNRVRQGGFPKTVCGVVKQKTTVVNSTTKICQFSWVCEGTKKVLFDSPAWGDSVQVAKIALTEKKVYDKFSSNVLFFHAKELETNWHEHYKKVKVVGNHVFYRIKYANERRNQAVQSNDRRTST